MGHNRRAKVTRKGSAVDIMLWETGIARLLPNPLSGHPCGPVFPTERRSRVALTPGDINP